jgi:phosphatidate cytidylyltransferase
MGPSSLEHLFTWRSALGDSFTLAVTLCIVGLFLLSGAVIRAYGWKSRMNAGICAELHARWKSWGWIALGILVPIWLGAAWVILAVLLLSLACHREFARATGLIREKSINVIVVLGILALTIAAFGHCDRLFFAITPLTVGMITIVTIPQDRPTGYLQRVGLGVTSFLLFGYSFGYLELIATDRHYRPILLLILWCVVLNDVCASCIGKMLGRSQLLPQTSPKKTVEGSVGAGIVTTVVVAVLAHLVFRGTAVDSYPSLLFLGILVAFLGQMGDLVVSSIKRDLGMKDLGNILPGHGGWLDRFDSLVLVPPAVFYFLSYRLGLFASDMPARILTNR